tara:strand:- start:832 stop:1362 length:531 start_codon:yes stop_codon:yes gene_type:complete
MSQLKVNSIIPVGGVASGQSGGVIQTVTVHKTNAFSHATATFTDITGLSVDITPVAANSKIFIVINVICGGQGNSFPAFRLRRNGTTNIALGTSQGSGQTQVSFGCRFVNETEIDSLGYTFVDTPSYSVGDTLTYNLRIASMLNNYSVRVNRPGPTANLSYALFGTSSITCQEVGT